MFNYDLKDRWGIYQIRNCKNGNIYIGKSQDIYTRWNEHLRKLKYNEHHCPNLQAEFNQYGLAAFDFSVLEFTPRNKTELWMREQYHIFDCEYEGEILNVYSAKDKEIYELAKMCREERIPFTTKTRMGGNTFDLIIYRDDDCSYIKHIVDVIIFDGTQTEERLAQIESTRKKHLEYCIGLGMEW